jgi:HD domain
VANFVDLKSPYFLGHARAVSELAAEAGSRLGLADAEVRMLSRAGLVHDFGRLGVSNAVLDKRGRLSGGDLERLRLQPYLTERMLRQSGALAPMAAIAVQHRERLDGSGHPRGLSGADISQPARVLGAADAYQAMREPRPHRAARTAEEAAAELRAEVRAGRLDADASEAVLGAAGHRVPPAARGPRRADPARGGGAPPARARAIEQGDRRAPRDLAQDGRQPRRAHLREDRSLDSGRCRPLRDAARAPPGGLVPGAGARLSAAQACCISFMFLSVAASVLASCSAGLNRTSSVPGDA